MHDLETIRWMNANPELYRKQKDKQMLLRDLENAESALATAKRRLAMLEEENED